MKKAIIFLIFILSVIIIGSSSCSPSRDVRYHKNENNGIFIKHNKRHNDRGVKVKVRKERRRGHIKPIDNDKPVIIIDKNR